MRCFQTTGIMQKEDAVESGGHLIFWAIEEAGEKDKGIGDEQKSLKSNRKPKFIRAKNHISEKKSDMMFHPEQSLGGSFFSNLL